MVGAAVAVRLVGHKVPGPRSLLGGSWAANADVGWGEKCWVASLRRGHSGLTGGGRVEGWPGPLEALHGLAQVWTLSKPWESIESCKQESDLMGLAFEERTEG